LSAQQTEAQKTGLGGSGIGRGDTQNPVDWYWSSSGGQICANHTSLSEMKKPCKRPKPGSIVVHIKGSEGKVRAPKSDVDGREGSNLVRPVRSFPR